MWVFSLVCLYLLIGMIFGFSHVASIKKRIIQAGEQELALRQMVGMHQFTPKGADYYTQLQELHISKGMLLGEYKLFKAGEFKYELHMFMLAVFLWPYFILSIMNNKK